MRLVILTVEAPNQAALCHTVEPACELVGVVLSRNIPTRHRARRLRRLLNRLEGRLVGRPYVHAWHVVQRRFHELAPRFPEVPTLQVPNVNDAKTVRWLEHLNPDLVLVSGTTLVGQTIRDWAASRGGIIPPPAARPIGPLRRETVEAEPLVRAVGGGIINLHTGLSPYVKGGPDCTNWCLAEGAFHLIGNTVLWLDAGIDSGPILATEQTVLSGQESLVELHWKVMTHAHDLCMRAVQAVAAGQQVPRIPQERIAEGRTFSSLDWNGRAMRRAWRNFRRDFSAELVRSRPFQELRTRVKTFPLIPRPAAGCCKQPMQVQE